MIIPGNGTEPNDANSVVDFSETLKDNEFRSYPKRKSFLFRVFLAVGILLVFLIAVVLILRLVD